MSDSERQLGIIVDLILPVDIATRYDVYFTDKRIAIVCMGKADRDNIESIESHSLFFGITPAVPVNTDRKRDKQIDEQINQLTLDEKMNLSKRSCYYNYDEIEKVKLISGKKPKFTILSKECVSKFSPNEDQLKQLTDLLPTIAMIENKLSIFGNLELNAIHKVKSTIFKCRYCSYENDLDALFCQSCGNQIQTEIPSNPTISEICCFSCGAKNKEPALFCKNCGKPTSKTQKAV
jgi:hypothetical protein